MLEVTKKILQQYAINEKVKLLDKVKSGELSREEAGKIIEERRVAWIENNVERLREKYKDLPLTVVAHRMIFYDHMYIFPPDSIVLEVAPDFIIIRSWSFCPYLEACKILGLDTRDICKNVCQKSFEEMIKYIHPDLRFGRNYDKIRPYEEYCEEYISLGKNLTDRTRDCHVGP